MCDYDEFSFTCGHYVIRRKSYCHFARNHPKHGCRSVKKLRNIWEQGRPCDECIQRHRQAQWEYYQSQMQSQGQGQDQDQGQGQSQGEGSTGSQ
ncbi:hypothetical protein VTH82DRAFT_1843 [Thermothelomyces myriococcoides]